MPIVKMLRRERERRILVECDKVCVHPRRDRTYMCAQTCHLCRGTRNPSHKLHQRNSTRHTVGPQNRECGRERRNSSPRFVKTSSFFAGSCCGQSFHPRRTGRMVCGNQIDRPIQQCTPKLFAILSGTNGWSTLEQ